MVKHFVKYNPAFLESDELIENFVVHQIDFRMIIRIIRENSMASNQHVLVIGPRGSGKTMLVRRVALEVERDEELEKACYPLIFAEESYNAVSAADFWLEALFHLAEQTGEAHKMRTYQELRRDPDEQRIGERALWELLDFADKIGKRILLVVENLDMLLSEFSDKQEAWKLRHTLMNEPRLMLLATAIGRSEAIDHPAHAMFELFKIHELRALDDQECNMIWELIAGQKLPGEQIRPVRILTGGNARLIALIARFGARRSFQELLDDLVDLIDEHTDYFKSHLDAMASKERKVYLALAELWSLSTAKEVAEVARLDVNTASALLNRLVGKGKVLFEDNGKRTKWYRISEGIYNIYYLMRRRGSPSARVNAAVRFMVSLYDPVSAATMLIDETGALLPEQCRDHYAAFEEVIRSVHDHQLLQKIGVAIPQRFLDSPYLSDTVKNILVVENMSQTKQELLDESAEELKAIIVVLESAHNLFKNEQYEQALQSLDEIIVKYRDCHEVEVAELVATAMLNKGLTLGQQNRQDEEIQSYEECVILYGSRSEVDIARVLARALNNKAAVLWGLRHEDKAVIVYKELVAMYKARSEVIIAEQVAMAMYYIGIILAYLNCEDEAIQSYEELIALYRDRPEVVLAEHVAKSMFNKGVVLDHLERYQEAAPVFVQAIKQAPLMWEAYVEFLKLLLKMPERQNDALKLARKYAETSVLIEQSIEGAIELFVELAASGYAREALGILVDSPAEPHLEPLVVALRLYIGEEVKSAIEIQEVAKDVVKRIDARQKAIRP
ncbi:MAG: ATP-binding protein [Chlorobium sp.]|jgi:tetratricopeptide (TPR) repeat protein|nr:ATP-binding protein [Chlorobium sp.]